MITPSVLSLPLFTAGRCRGKFDDRQDMIDAIKKTVEDNSSDEATLASDGRTTNNVVGGVAHHEG